MTFTRIIVSYVIDWAVILLVNRFYHLHQVITISSVAAAIALSLSTVNPDFHTFCLLDMNISYPYRPAKVSLGLFIFLAIITPVIIIVFVSLFLDPKNQGSRRFTREQIWRQRLWEMNAALLGIGVSLGTSTVIFTGVKNLAGKPRPNFLERCQPDLDNVAAHTVGGFGQAVSNLWVMVDVEICQQPDKKWLNDGFRSFPSGYATSGSTTIHNFMVLIWIQLLFRACGTCHSISAPNLTSLFHHHRAMTCKCKAMKLMSHY